MIENEGGFLWERVGDPRTPEGGLTGKGGGGLWRLEKRNKG